MSEITSLIISNYHSICRLCLKNGNNYNKLIEVLDDEAKHKICEVTGIEVNSDKALPQNVCRSCLRQVYNFYNFRKRSLCSNETIRLHYLMYKDETPDPLEQAKDEHKIQQLNSQFHETSPPLRKPDEFTAETIRLHYLMYKDDTPDPLELEKDEPELQQLNSRFHEISTPLSNPEEVNAVHSAKREPLRKSHRATNSTKYIISSHRNRALRLNKNNLKVELGTEQKSKSSYINCEICDEPIKKHHLEPHINEHNNIAPYSCIECPKSFLTARQLRRHKVAVHIAIDECECPICGVVCKSRPVLEKHHRTIHEQKYYCICEICDMTFQSQSSLKRHMLIHADIKPFSCSQCSMEFRTQTNLKRHILTHTNERVYKCEICDADFSYPRALKNHVKIHVEDDWTRSQSWQEQNHL